MSNIFKIGEIKTGEYHFVSCKCNNESLIPVLLQDGNYKIIASLVCTDCDYKINVVNGILAESEDVKLL